MSQWNWLTKPETPYTWRFARNVAIKGLILFALANVIFALVNPQRWLGGLSIYNVLTPGRERLPYAENVEESYNLSLLNLDAMFASHEIAGAHKAADEYRVLLIGDSSVWGILLDADQTLASDLNRLQLKTAHGKHIRVFNVGYPGQTITRDVLLLQYAMRYQPDLIVWSVTLESLAANDQQFDSLLVRDNPELVRALIDKYHLTSVNPSNHLFSTATFWDRTIIGQRRTLADLLRLQLYGPAWAVTQVDERYPRFYEPRRENFDTNVIWQGFQPPRLTDNEIALDAFAAGLQIIGSTPVIVVNEPIFISHGVNSDLRYNFFYPRWAYDAYRTIMAQQARDHGVTYVDLWNVISPDQFTDSAVHLTPPATQQLAGLVGKAITDFAG